MWSYAASGGKAMLESVCYEDDKVFAVDYTPPSETQNRSLVIQLDLEERDFYQAELMGNQIAFVLPRNKHARAGLVSQTVNLLQQFSEIVRPYIKIHNILLEDKSSIVVQIKIKGCKEVSGFEITEPEGLEFTFEKMVEKIETVTHVLKYHLMLEVDGVKAKFKTSGGVLRFNLLCDSQYHSSDEKVRETLFAELKSEKASVAVRDGMNFPTSHFYGSAFLNFDILKLIRNKALLSDKDKRDFFFFHSRSFNKIAILTQPTLALQVGPYFPILFFYNKRTNKMDIDFDEMNIPGGSVIDSTKSDTTGLLELGIGSTLEQVESSEQLILAIQAMKENWDSVSVNISRPKRSERVGDMERSDLLSNKGKEPAPILLKRVDSFFDARLFDYHSDVFTPKEGVYMNMDWFIRHIGDRAYFKMQIRLGALFDEEEGVSSDLKKIHNVINTHRLSGKIVIYDERIIARNEGGQATGMVSDKVYSGLPSNPGVYIVNKEMRCSSLNTTLEPVLGTLKGEEESLGVENTVFMKRYVRDNLDFYSLFFYKDPANAEVGVINLYVSAYLPETSYVLRHKSKKFILRPNGKTLKTGKNALNKNRNLTVFEYRGAILDLDFGGRLLRLYGAKDDRVLLDCFLEWQSGVLDLADEYDVYQEKMSRVLKDLKTVASDIRIPDPEEFGVLNNSRDTKVLGVGVFGVWMLLIFWMLLGESAI